jgi:hypothetical protein
MLDVHIDHNPFCPCCQKEDNYNSLDTKDTIFPLKIKQNFLLVLDKNSIEFIVVLLVYDNIPLLFLDFQEKKVQVQIDQVDNVIPTREKF